MGAKATPFQTIRAFSIGENHAAFEQRRRANAKSSVPTLSERSNILKPDFVASQCGEASQEE